MKSLGIVGLKVDFWPGDGHSAIAYYHDVLEESARAGLLMSFHGSHLMTMEERVPIRTPIVVRTR